ncbi:hypothetical protein FISHEDRAFT_77391, partial [Fistulina hepatica ATCC 64428]
MPLFLRWGGVNPPHTLPAAFPPTLSYIHPTSNNLQSLRIYGYIPATGPVATPAPASLAGPSRFPTQSELSASFPPVNRFTRQREGESMQEFFERRQVQFQGYLENETSKERQSRLQREANAEGGLCPGKKGARVYVWDDVDGYRIRRFGTRNEDVWCSYSVGQRRYNSQWDEWDLCTEFAPDEEPDAYDLGAVSDDGWEPEALLQPTLASGPPRHPQGLSSADDQIFDKIGNHFVDADLDQMYPPDMDNSVPLVVAPTLLDIAYEVFGFNQLSGDELPQQQLVEWGVVLKFLGVYWKTNREDPSATTKDSLRVFFTFLSKARILSDIPSSILDLQQDDSDVSLP